MRFILFRPAKGYDPPLSVYEERKSVDERKRIWCFPLEKGSGDARRLKLLKFKELEDALYFSTGLYLKTGERFEIRGFENGQMESWPRYVYDANTNTYSFLTEDD